MVDGRYVVLVFFQSLICVQASALAYLASTKSAAGDPGRLLKDDFDEMPQEWRTSIDSLRKAAESGHAVAQLGYASKLEHGKGIEKDAKQSACWYRKAAEQNNSFAQFALAHCLRTGFGVDKNEQEAFEWYSKCAAQGNLDGQNMVAW